MVHFCLYPPAPSHCSSSDPCPGAPGGAGGPSPAPCRGGSVPQLLLQLLLLRSTPHFIGLYRFHKYFHCLHFHIEIGKSNISMFILGWLFLRLLELSNWVETFHCLYLSLFLSLGQGYNCIHVFTTADSLLHI